MIGYFWSPSTTILIPMRGGGQRFLIKVIEPQGSMLLGQGDDQRAMRI